MCKIKVFLKLLKAEHNIKKGLFNYLLNFKKFAVLVLFVLYVFNFFKQSCLLYHLVKKEIYVYFHHHRKDRSINAINL